MIRFGSFVCLSLVLCIGSTAWSQSSPADPVPPTGATPSKTGATLASSSSQSTPPAATASLTAVDLMAMLRLIDPYKPDEDLDATVKIYGSTAMDAMAHMWADGFKLFHKDVKVEVSAAGSGDAFDQLRKNPSALVMLSRPVTAEELAKLKSDTIKEPAAFVVGREALGVYVHESNPAKYISGEQLRLIFTTQGKEEDLKWKLLGVTGPAGERPIHLVARSESSGTQQFLRDFVFGGLQMRTASGSHASNADALGALTKDHDAITICGLRASGVSVKVLPLVAGGTIINSDDAAVLSGRYPLTRNLTLVVDLAQNDPAAKAAQELVHFALCQSGQVAAIRAGFYPAELHVLRDGLARLHHDPMH
ncbi:MAG: substrate-binding domain-containing protein [Pirellulales bacterium]